MIDFLYRQQVQLGTKVRQTCTHFGSVRLQGLSRLWVVKDGHVGNACIGAPLLEGLEMAPSHVSTTLCLRQQNPMH